MFDHINKYNFHLPNDIVNNGCLADFYKIEKIIGKGGFSIVVLATDRRTKV